MYNVYYPGWLEDLAGGVMKTEWYLEAKPL